MPPPVMKTEPTAEAFTIPMWSTHGWDVPPEPGMMVYEMIHANKSIKKLLYFSEVYIALDIKVKEMHRASRRDRYDSHPKKRHVLRCHQDATAHSYKPKDIVKKQHCPKRRLPGCGESISEQIRFFVALHGIAVSVIRHNGPPFFYMIIRKEIGQVLTLVPKFNFEMMNTSIQGVG